MSNERIIAADEGSITEWLQVHAREVAIGVVIIAVAIGGFFLYRQSSRSTELAAEQRFFSAQGAAGDTASQERALDQVIAGYEGTAGAAQAAMVLAQLRYDQGKFDEGLATLRRLDSGGTPDEFEASVQSLIAVGLEAKRSYGEAAARYQQAAEAARFEADRDAFRADAARALRLAGDEAAAVKIWTELAADPVGPMAAEARVRLGEMTIKPVGRS